MFSLVKWKRLATQKHWGGWGLKYFTIFGQTLAAKSLWRCLFDSGLWGFVTKRKYSGSLTIVDWCQIDSKQTRNCSNIWKNMVGAFPIIGNWVAWWVGYRK